MYVCMYTCTGVTTIQHLGARRSRLFSLPLLPPPPASVHPAHGGAQHVHTLQRPCLYGPLRYLLPAGDWLVLCHAHLNSQPLTGLPFPTAPASRRASVLVLLPHRGDSPTGGNLRVVQTPFLLSVERCALLGLPNAAFVSMACFAAGRLAIETRRCAASRPVALTSRTLSPSRGHGCRRCRSRILPSSRQVIIRGRPGCRWAWRVGESSGALVFAMMETGSSLVCSWCRLAVCLAVRGEQAIVAWDKRKAPTSSFVGVGVGVVGTYHRPGRVNSRHPASRSSHITAVYVASRASLYTSEAPWVWRERRGRFGHVRRARRALGWASCCCGAKPAILKLGATRHRGVQRAAGFCIRPAQFPLLPCLGRDDGGSGIGPSDPLTLSEVHFPV